MSSAHSFIDISHACISAGNSLFVAAAATPEDRDAWGLEKHCRIGAQFFSQFYTRLSGHTLCFLPFVINIWRKKNNIHLYFWYICHHIANHKYVYLDTTYSQLHEGLDLLASLGWMMRPHSELTCGSQVERRRQSASAWVCISTASSPGIRSTSEAHPDFQLPSVLVPTSLGLCPIGEIQYWMMTRLMTLGLLILFSTEANNSPKNMFEAC